jgi:hypothetical protein
MPKVTPRQIHNKGNKNTETKNQYNFSQTYPNQRRKRQSCPKHIDQFNKPKRHPKFNWQPSAPIPNTRSPPTIPRAPRKPNKIDKKAKPNKSIYSTNKNPWIKPVLQIHPRTNQNVFPVKYRTNTATNQNAPSHRNKLKSPNTKATKSTKTIDLYKENENAFTEIAGDNVQVVKCVDTRQRSPRSSQRRRVVRGNDPLSTSALPTPSPPLRVPTTTSQTNNLRGQQVYSKMRLERHELRSFSKRTLAPITSTNEEHHASRLRNILDVQSDALERDKRGYLPQLALKTRRNDEWF